MSNTYQDENGDTQWGSRGADPKQVELREKEMKFGILSILNNTDTVNIKVEKIHDLIDIDLKERGYVKLAKVQTLPTRYHTIDGQRERWLKKAGWRKVE